MKNNWNVALKSEQESSRERINHFFRSRKNFECINGTHEYFNIDTGTQFSFTHYSDNNVVNLRIDLNTSNSNTIREAINEISALVKKFSLKICYVDNDLIPEDFIINRFIQKWHEIKRDYLDFHYDAVKFPIPTDRIKSTWYWNYSSKWTERFLKNLFEIPKIQFLNRYGKAHTVATVNLNRWTAVPEADFYKLSYTPSKSLFCFSPETQETLVTRNDFEAVLKECRFLPFEKTPFYKLRPEEFRPQFKKFFISGLTPNLKVIEPAKIIDKEIFDGKKIKKLEESTY